MVLIFSRPHAEHWKLWDLTSPSLSFMTCSLGSIYSRGQEPPYLGRLSSKCDPDGDTFLELVNRPPTTCRVLKNGCDAALFGAVRLARSGSPRPNVYPLVAPHPGRLLDTAHQLWRFERSSTCMLTFDLSHPYVLIISRLSDLTNKRRFFSSR
jgi:hypothetical protein